MAPMPRSSATCRRSPSGELRLQAFGVTEPTTGSDTTQLKTMAVRKGDRYIVNGQKVWISRAEHSDLLLLVARTTPIEQVKKRTEGLSILLVDLRQAVGHGLTIRPIRTMMNHATTELFFDDLEVPVENLVGEEGRGFRYLLDGLNAERILIAAECIGDGRWFVDRATRYAKERVVFGRAIGQNQGIQFPIARAHVNVEAADLMRFQAADMFDRGEACGAEANMAKLLAADASWEAANVAVQTYGGFGFAEEYDIERKFRETRLYQVAPISTNLILTFVAEHVLGLPLGRGMTDDVSVSSMLPTLRPHRRLARAGGGRAVRHAAARRSGGAGHQDRAARSRRFRPRLRHDGEGAGEPLRLAEPIEAVADARHQAARGARGAGAAAGAGRRVRAEPGAGSVGAPGARRRHAARPPSAAHRRRPVGIRLDRSVPGQEGLRPADSERSRTGVDHGHARDAVEGRNLGRRHRGGDVPSIRAS